MGSSAANKLIFADRKGSYLQNVNVSSYADVANKQPRSVRDRVSDNIIEGLAELKELGCQLAMGVAYEIHFSNGEIQLKLCPCVKSILPTDEVMLNLLSQR